MSIGPVGCGLIDEEFDDRRPEGMPTARQGSDAGRETGRKISAVMTSVGNRALARPATPPGGAPRPEISIGGGSSSTPRRSSVGRTGAATATWLPRNLHPIAWWLWALGLVVAASRTTNPFLLGSILGVAGFVVMRRRGTAPWARAFRYYLIFGLFVIVIRVVTRVVFGGANAEGTHELFALPQIPLPDWAAGITIGGPVMAEAVLAAAFDGLRLATIIACIGAANALANPKRALRVLPGALYELGVAVVIAITVAPQMIAGVQRVRRARSLRGDGAKGLRGMGRIALPVLQDALDRSLALAAAMDSRGYGRRAAVDERQRRLTVVLLIGGLVALSVGVYGLLGGASSPSVVIGAMTLGVAACAGGMAVGSRRVHHTSYAPDPWDIPESLVTAAGLGCAIVFVVVGRYDLANLNPPLSPLAWPTLPIVPALAVLIAATPAVSAPAPPLPRVAARSAQIRNAVAS